MPMENNMLGNAKAKLTGLLVAILAVLCVSCFACVEDAHAVIASGTQGTCDWVIDDDGVLTISPTNGVSGVIDGNTTTTSYYWAWDSEKSNVERVVITAGVSVSGSAGHMFEQYSNLETADISLLDMSSVTNADAMFRYSSLTSVSLPSAWNTSMLASNVSLNRMFEECSNLESVNISSWNLSRVSRTDYMFKGCTSLTSLSLPVWDTSSLTVSANASYMFYNCSLLSSFSVSQWNVSKVSNVKAMFCGCTSLTSLDIQSWNLSNVSDASAMFNNCTSLTSISMPRTWDTSNVVSGVDVQTMFANDSSLQTLDISLWNMSKVINAHSMFQNCSALTSLSLPRIWDTSLAPSDLSMSYMFYGCRALSSLDLSGFDTSNVSNMTSMFSGTSSLSSVNLSANFSFKGNSDEVKTRLMIPPDSHNLTGNWTNGNQSYSATLLAQNYDGLTMAGIWYWEERPNGRVNVASVSFDDASPVAQTVFSITDSASYSYSWTASLPDAQTPSTAPFETINVYAGSTYTLSMTTAAPGYFRTEATVSIAVDSSGNVTLTKSPSDSPLITISQVSATEADVTVKSEAQRTVAFTKYAEDGFTMLAGASMQLLDASQSVVDSWTSSASEAHSTTTLRDGTYTLHEQAPPAEYQTAADISFQLSSSGVSVINQDTTLTALNAFALSMTDQRIPPAIASHAYDPGDGNQRISAVWGAGLYSDVAYSHLVPGRSYTLTATLKVKSTGVSLTNGGYPVVSQAVFTPASPSGTQRVEFVFDASDYGGQDILVCQSLAESASPLVELASHANANDADLTVGCDAVYPTAADLASDPYVAMVAVFGILIAALRVSSLIRRRHPDFR